MNIKMNKLFAIVLTVLLFTLAGCEKDDNLVEPKEFTFNFINNTESWAGDFADYPNEPNVEDFYELEFSHSMLPSPLNSSEGALRQSGNNHSDDLFMFVKKRITGLEPNTNYKIDIEIEIATNVASGSFGVGGSPGESVYIKAGASTNEPMKVLDNSDNYYRMNIDKGNQSQGGTNMKLIGDFANGSDLNVYKLKILKTTSPVNVMSNSNGELWIIVGTDSGFEATTTIYYNRITVNVK
jgi:hypothetical protein